ncbi:TIGR02594 family protein [Zavarzinia aquatilis]|uniref:N-acetylmuramoyl-L-alanine amidase n=1 Tax=Zavarzinia aquatilis TaxID=2211142 RepID=A0A317DXV5_9PROT|nr:TIGR02594 family protein [Zavarzinia aquatilis]PWR19312.1 hypothetical protein DKG74_17695 [Zavarzinia aquatilis]
MVKVVDVATNVGTYAAQIAAAGVTTVIRYYNHRDVNIIGKCLTLPELQRLHAAGLSVAVVFEQRAGAGDETHPQGFIEDFKTGAGTRDANRALALAHNLGQPAGSAIYFAVDHDFARTDEVNQIVAYFKEVADLVRPGYRLGAYGSGHIGFKLFDAGLIDLFWLAGGRKWTRSDEMSRSGRWALWQSSKSLKAPFGGIGYDTNDVNPAFPDFGQFSAAGVQPIEERIPARAVYKVKARDGLRLRSGPSDQSDRITSLPVDTVVYGLSLNGEWLQVDCDGDGLADGYMSINFLSSLSGGLPIAEVAGKRPIDVARAELARDVRENPGDDNNDRIVLYHSSTKGGAAPDETAWCSSFVNYCVEQAGLQGTDSKWAMSWHDTGWGQDVTDAPDVGDIAVFKRRQGGPSGAVLGGHVGFYLSQGDGKINLLGGNQANTIKTSAYPINGMSGPYHYKLLSIRRPPG